MDIAVHFGLEMLGECCLGCMLLLCKHDHFESERINSFVHSRMYRLILLMFFNLLFSYITVKAVG